MLEVQKAEAESEDTMHSTAGTLNKMFRMYWEMDLGVQTVRILVMIEVWSLHTNTCVLSCYNIYDNLGM